MKILVTGGAGYIGGHTCVELLKAGHSVTVLDNFCNSSPEAITRIEKITGKKITLVRGDIRVQATVEAALKTNGCDAVIHFAGLKAVGESMEKPLIYYDNNVVGTQKLLAGMQTVGVKTIVFSSSATVYGEPKFLPYTEMHPLAALNVYGRTKLMIEDILRDVHNADANWRIGILRYFNPVGAHESGLIGEDPQGVPQNLMPFIAQVAVGRREKLSVFGDDYDTADGTGVRDYIHVVDLAEGHVAALDYLQNKGGMLTVNLGTGRGFSVLELAKAFEKASGKTIPFQIVPRRAGDLAAYWADPATASRLLNWKAKRTIDAMCEDVWRWQSNNPNGYASS